MNRYPTRFLRLILGLFLFALGSYCTIQAGIGLAPWEAFHTGGANLTGLSYGNVAVVTSFIILIIDIFLKEKVGIGTILNSILIGKFIDLIRSVNIIPAMPGFWLGLPMMLLGQVIISLGSYFYIGAALGSGPRDGLMVALGKRLPRVPIGVIRGMLEGAVLLAGWALGAKVGVGTAVYVLGIGFILQFTFRLLRFDVKGVRHESMADTVGNVRKGFAPRPKGDQK